MTEGYIGMAIVIGIHWPNKSLFRSIQSLSPGMGFVVYIFELLVYQLGIDLSGGNIRMTQHLLYGMQISPIFQQMGGKGMA